METFYDVLSDIYAIILDHVSQDVLMSIVGSVIGYLIRRFLPIVFGDFVPENKPEDKPKNKSPSHQRPSFPIPTSPDVSRESTSSRDSTLSQDSIVSNHYDDSRYRPSVRRVAEKAADMRSSDGSTDKHGEYKYESKKHDHAGIDNNDYRKRESVGDDVHIQKDASTITVEEIRNESTDRVEPTAADIPFVYRVLKESIQNGGVLKHLIDYIVMLRNQHDQCQRELRYWQQQYAELSAHYQEVVRKQYP